MALMGASHLCVKPKKSTKVLDNSTAAGSHHHKEASKEDEYGSDTIVRPLELQEAIVMT